MEAGDKCQHHESDDDLQGMLRSRLDKELGELCRASERGTASNPLPGAVPFADIVRLRKVYLQTERPSSTSTPRQAGPGYEPSPCP